MKRVSQFFCAVFTAIISACFYSTLSAATELIMAAPCTQMNPYSMDSDELLWERPGGPVYDQWEIKTGLLGTLWRDSSSDFSAWTGITSPSRTLTLWPNAVPYTSSAMQTACPGYSVVGSFINTWSTSMEGAAGGPHSTFLFAFRPNTGPKLADLFARNPGQKLTAQFWAAVPRIEIGASLPPGTTCQTGNDVTCQLSASLTLHHLGLDGYPDRAYEILLNAFESRPRCANYAPQWQLNADPKLFSMPIGDSYPAYSGFDPNFARQRTAAWSGLQLFRANFTVAQLGNILAHLGDANPDFSRYRISQYGTLHEVPNHLNNANEMSCGAMIAEPALLMM